MKIQEIQDLFIKEGIATDPRGKEAVDFDLKKRKSKFDELSDEKKKLFDVESLTNPYYDSRILYGNKNSEVKSVLVGIDVETPEITLAQQLINSGKKIDLIIAHHPEGYAYSTFSQVVEMQADILHKYGVPINIAEKIICERQNEVCRSILPQNNERVYDAAKLLNIPLMTAHTVADNHVVAFLQEKIEMSSPNFLKDIVKILNEFPEYQHAASINSKPFILSGNDYSRCGKIFVDMTGGTEGPIEAFQNLSKTGVGTLVSMHLSSKAVKEAEKYHMNIVLAGHISSDNLGLNLLFDKLEKSLGKIEFLEFSGFRRFRRNS
ncbi:MAG: Nif3-like dinuclear metal center hexameric protein [Elusimicrobiota bacterium]|jgi:putative NIF3 family GTP cyclohydrolase 1 type 2|nr:Nif3-like dinuclear metal center hexameric protein [Elusimicrobiota bacterium]